MIIVSSAWLLNVKRCLKTRSDQSVAADQIQASLQNWWGAGVQRPDTGHSGAHRGHETQYTATHCAALSLQTRPGSDRSQLLSLELNIWYFNISNRSILFYTWSKVWIIYCFVLVYVFNSERERRVGCCGPSPTHFCIAISRVWAAGWVMLLKLLWLEFFVFHQHISFSTSQSRHSGLICWGQQCWCSLSATPLICPHLSQLKKSQL